MSPTSQPNSVTLSDFVKALQIESINIEERSRRMAHDERASMSELFREAIDKTITDLHDGAEVDEFYCLTVANLIIIAAQEGYTSLEIKAFISKLSVTPDDDQEEE